ncbi:MAG: hypothetical protein HY681_04465 [Chloroflexi bacterium]|nr:hypothetical protein [Chloroflexota bacterium]
MKTVRFWWIGVAAVVIALVSGAVLTLPAWAAQPQPGQGHSAGASEKMHEACQAGDVQGMQDPMNSLSQEDWDAMKGHMNDGHHGAMGSGMSGMGSGVMGAGRMMGW